MPGVYEGYTFLRRVLDERTRFSPQLGGLVGQGEFCTWIFQLVPHSIVFDRRPIRPGIVLQVLLEVYEQGSLGIKSPLQAIERDPLVQGVKLIQSLRLVKLPQLQLRAYVLESRQPFLRTDEDAGVSIVTADASDRDVRRVPHKVRAFVAALQSGAVEVPNRLFDDRLPIEVLHDHLPSDDVYPTNVVEVDATLVPDL